MSKAVAEFFDKLRHAREATLVVDYDGTLAPFAVERDRARPYPAAAALLREIADESTTRVVVLSGRSIADLLPLVIDLDVNELWGSHGWERWVRGRHETQPLPPAARTGLDDAFAFAAQVGLESICERKPVGLAFHWRGKTAGEIEALRGILQEPLQRIAALRGLTLHAFDGGLELRVPGHDKGTALAEIISADGNGTPVAYLGDDITDEDAFAMLRGRGLGVLVRPTRRSTAAQAWIAPPEGLFDFLETWLNCRRSAAAQREDE